MVGNLFKMIPKNLPKAELHCHLEGTIPPLLAKRIAKRNNIDLPRLLFKDKNTYAWNDFTSFLEAYDQASLCLRSAQDYRDITYEYLSICASEGAIYVEVFTSPDHAAECGISYNEHVKGVTQAFKDAEKDFGIIGRAIVTCVRHFGPEKAMAVADSFIENPHPYFVGFGMGGDEGHLSYADFKPVFDKVAAAGYPCTTHAGEHFGPETIIDAINTLPISRIGHGVRISEDAQAVKEIAKQGIVLEICPGSNVSLGVYSDYSEHPFPQLREAGCKVTLNSDDPPFFDTNIGKEYENAHTNFKLSIEDLLDITRTAIDAAFINDNEKAKLHSRIDSWKYSG